jgi:AcrR family transcriptional regulator
VLLLIRYDAAVAKPLIPVSAIQQHALELLTSEGPEALTTRRLAADLRISTKTLYAQVGSRDQLIRVLVADYFAALKLDFHEAESWEATALQWCLTLDTALREHPFLTELMTVEDRTAVMKFVGELTKASVRAGIPRTRATECSRALVTLTINHAVAEVRAMRDPVHSRMSADHSRRIEKNFRQTIRWILAGVRDETDP